LGQYIQSLHYGLYVNGELVAAGADVVYDNGKTILAQGLRVGQEHRNKGYSKILETKRDELRREGVLSRHPHVERTRWGVGVRNKQVQEAITKEHKTQQTKTLSVRSLFTISTDSAYLQKIIQLEQRRGSALPRITQLTTKEAYKFATTHPELFSCNSIPTDWDMYEISYENFIILSSGGDGTFPRFFLKLQDSSGRESFAVCGTTPRGDGTCFMVDIFTTDSQDMVSLASYALQNMNKLRTNFSRSLENHIWIWIPYELTDSKEYQTILREVSTDPRFYALQGVFFEKPFPTTNSCL